MLAGATPFCRFEPAGGGELALRFPHVRPEEHTEPAQRLDPGFRPLRLPAKLAAGDGHAGPIAGQQEGRGGVFQRCGGPLNQTFRELAE
jgi:hypothetical protein